MGSKGGGACCCLPSLLLWEVPTLDTVLSTIDYFFKNFAYRLMDILPYMGNIDSDFAVQASNFLGWLNWFLPIRDCAAYMGSTLSLVAIYYSCKYILKRMGII